MKNILLLLCIVCHLSYTYAKPTDIEIQRSKLSTATSYEQKTAIFFELSKAYTRNNPDSSYKYAKLLEALAKRHNDRINLAKADLRIASYLSRTGKPQEALLIIEKNIHTLINDSENRWLLGSYYQQRGNCKVFINKKEEALSDFYAALKLFEQIDSLSDYASCHVNIGWVYMELFHFEKAITELQKANSIYLQNTDKIPPHFVATMYNNLASSYGSLGQLDSAYAYINKGIEVALKNQDYQSAANGLNILGTGLLDQKRYTEALDKLKQAKLLREKVGDPFFIVSDMSVLARAYGEMGQINEGIKISEEAIAYAQKNQLESKLPLIYLNLSFIYERAEDYKNALDAYKMLSAIKDSLYEKANAEALAKLQVQYETEKKEAENKLLAEENALKEAKIGNKNRTIYLLVISIFLTISLTFIWAYQIRLKRKESELNAIQQLQKEKERIARDLHDNIGGQLSYIIYSLDGISEEPKEKRDEITESINQSVRGVIADLRETIWAISDANVTIQDFCDRLKVYTRKLYKHTNAVVKFNEDIEIKRELNALLGLNIYRICQEILTNAFKHSKADEITIEIQSYKEKLTIVIIDNGVGFDTVQQNQEGYGLENMRKRASEFGISLSLHSTIGKGTRYTIIV